MGPSHRLIVRLLMLGAAPLATGACTLAGVPASTGAPVAPVSAAPARDAAAGPTERRTARAADEAAGGTAHELTAGVVEVALRSIGTPYEWGGTDANGFDCSGLIQYAYGRMGVRLPRRSTAQIRSGAPVDPRPQVLRPGDVLGFAVDGKGGTSHVGLYIGDDRFIHSSSSGVRISTLRNSYWERRLVAARRIVE